jgi:predicted transcriptional regulator
VEKTRVLAWFCERVAAKEIARELKKVTSWSNVTVWTIHQVCQKKLVLPSPCPPNKPSLM